jgi:hypothetical protein
MEIEFELRYRANRPGSLSMEEQNAEMMARMVRMDLPFGLNWLNEWPVVTVEKEDDWTENFWIVYPENKLQCHLCYTNLRDNKEEISCDDVIKYVIEDSASIAGEYHNILHNQYPAMIEHFKAYHARLWMWDYIFQYKRMCPEVPLERNRAVDKNNAKKNIRCMIFYLHPAQYWDEEMCYTNLGYGPEEVIRRLERARFKGRPIPRVQEINGGVYSVLSDEANMSYEEFEAMNKYYAKVLGIKQRSWWRLWERSRLLSKWRKWRNGEEE